MISDKEQPKWIMLLLAFIFFLALLIGVLVAVMFSLSDSTLNIFPDIKTYPKSNIMMNSELDYPTDKGICIVNRNEWQARPPTELLRQQKLPLERVIITHTGTESCYTSEDCRSSIRIIQRFDIESLGFFDTIYNFLIGGDGCVYIGRGWDYYGSHTRQYNMKTLGIGLIGTFSKMPPTASQLNATLKLIDLGTKLGKLTKDYILTASCQLRPTLSPGKLVYDVISKWDHFNTSIETPPCTFQDIKID
uniref:Peptidoglycan-recognition protein n=1 Tax=Clastoptera arizonana TaxID=38151 RepID=A0A1B6CE38_9HEMI